MISSNRQRTETDIKEEVGAPNARSLHGAVVKTSAVKKGLQV